jgi:hypothetical protein
MIRARNKRIALAALALTIAVSIMLTPAPTIDAADHGDAPLTAHDQGCDINDVYLFLDPNDNSKVTIILTFHGFIVPGEASNFGIFDPAIRYRFQIENTGDAKPDAFIDVNFTQRVAVNGSPVAQTATINCAGFAGNRSFTAPATNSSNTADVAPTPVITTDATTGISFFAGLTDDPFFFDIPAFSRFVASVRAGAPNTSFFQRGRDTFAGYNTLAIAFSIPVALVRNGGNQLGVNCLTQRHSPRIYNTQTGEDTGSGRWVNIDRMGLPAVNVAFVPFNSKNAYNAGNTIDDANGKFAAGIVSTLNLFGTNPTYQAILANVAINRGDILRLDLTKANTGTNPEASFPNGRRLTDDVIDIELTLVNNGNTLGDNVNANDVPFRTSFPFLAPSQQPRIPGTIDDNTRN